MEKETHCPRCQAVNKTFLGKIYCHNCGLLIADMTPPGQQASGFSQFIVIVSAIFGTLIIICLLIAFAMVLAPDFMANHFPFLSFLISK